MIVSYSRSMADPAENYFVYWMTYPKPYEDAIWIVPGTIDPVSLEVISWHTGEPMRHV
jgi:hypothetical protein